MKSILLIGQSNMAEPIHFDRPFAGIGLAASFAQAWCDANDGEEIGLIPCAEGGSSIDEWKEEDILFRHAVSEAKYAMENSDLIAVLWHQGESESDSGKYQTYYQKLDVMIQAFRNALGAQDIPFLVGGLPDFLGKYGMGLSCTEYQLVNQELLRYADNNENCFFVSGDHLYANPDGLHINAESQRRFGVRYFEAYQTKSNIMGALTDETLIVNKFYEKEETEGEKR